MAPKKGKGRKAAADNWEDDLGESPETMNASTPAPVSNDGIDAAVDGGAATHVNAPVDGGDDGDAGSGVGGGLMAMLKKRGGGAGGKKGKKGRPGPYPDWEDELGEVASGAADPSPEPAAVPEKPTPPSKTTTPADDDDQDDNQDTQEPGRVKTKKEKEREKKEREKQRKKEQAAKKKSGGPDSGPADKPTAPTAKPVEAVKVAAPVEEEPVAAPAKGKKVSAAVRALQKQQELRRKAVEEQARLEAEERARIEEEERKEAEEQRLKEEQKAAKKQREREKVEQLKREGKYLTKAQKEAARRLELRRTQLLESGATVVAGLQQSEADRKKRPVYNAKKKKKSDPVKELAEKTEELQVVESAPEPEAEPTPEPEPEPEAEADGVEDWEQLADGMDGVKDSWDQSSDEEETKKADGDEDGDDDDDSDDDEDDSDDDESEEEEKAPIKRSEAERADATRRREEKHQAALAAASTDNLRSPICCILGHVDTGKTKLLDKIRQTNVQEGEAGGITQQIGATYFPVSALHKKIAVVNQDGEFDFKVPGLLVIDTPGHESFTNLRSRGSSLCNIAILVIDIMHGLEPQTIESIQLLRDRKTPFIVALNKIDRLYSWNAIPNGGFRESFNSQSRAVQSEFEDRLSKVKLALAEQGLNSELFYENKSITKNVSLVPTSAHTGEGIPDLLKLLVGLTQDRMAGRLMYLSEVEATILEVKVVDGLGTTIDVILSNGILHEGDKIVLCGLNGAITTNIRALLTPAEMKELRVKSQYVHNKEIKAAMGIKIAADGLDSAIAGSRLLVVGEDDDEDDLADEVMSDLEGLLSRISTTGIGVSVQASTLGSLEALLEFLRASKIPVANISIGPVFKRDVMQCGAMLERSPDHAVMLCFDVRVDKEADQYARDVGVKIFTADIIYHLFDAFTAHLAQAAEQKKEESKMLAVFPCVLRPVAVFNKKDPIVIGVDVIEGGLRLHTPICAVKTDPTTGKKEILKLGRVTSIERDHKALTVVRKGEPSVAVKIEGNNQPLYGRQLEEKDILYSQISRKSIDVLKLYFKTDVTADEWRLMVKLKPLFDIA